MIFLTIVTQDKNGVIKNSELTWVGITEVNAKIYKTSFSDGSYRLTNKVHKFYTTDYKEIEVKDLTDELIISNSNNSVKVIESIGLNYTEDVYDLTAIPNYNFYSVLNKKEFVNTDMVIINDNISLHIYDIVNTINGQKFAIDLKKEDILI